MTSSPKQITGAEIDKARGFRSPSSRGARLVSAMVLAKPRPEEASKYTTPSLANRMRKGDPIAFQQRIDELVLGILVGDHQLFREIANHLEDSKKAVSNVSRKKTLFLTYVQARKAGRRITPREVYYFVADALARLEPGLSPGTDAFGRMVKGLIENGVRDDVKRWLKEYNVPVDSRRGKPPTAKPE